MQSIIFNHLLPYATILNMADDENLPTILTEDQVSDLVPELASTVTLSQAKEADVQVANTMLSLCYHSLSKATSISAVMKIIDTSMSIVERRRKLLCLQYGDSTKDSSVTFTSPLPD